MSPARVDSVYEEILGRDGASDRPCVLGDHPRSYGEVLSAASRIAEALRSQGCAVGTRVAVCLDQSTEYIASLLGIRRAGGIAVLMAPDWTDHEKARVLSHSESRLALADTPILCEDEPLRCTPLDGLDALVHAYDPSETETPEPGDAVLIYTSGTTGIPKGVVLTESGISANVRAVAAYLALAPDDSSPIFTPPCYAYSLSQNLTHLWSGAAILPLPSGLMFPLDVLNGVSSFGLTGISGTPTSFRILTQLDVEAGTNLDSVRYLQTGGQFLDSRLVGQMGTLFPRARIVNMYGASENSPRITYQWITGRSGMDRQGYFAVGQPVAGTRIRVDAREAPAAVPGEVGEILLTGTSLMRGYWKDHAATAERLVDGWFHTRDLGYLDAEGLLHLTGRQTSIINIGNEKVSPEEVEKVLAEIPGVVEVAVFGAPDPLLGESVHAQIVLEPGARVQISDLQRHCRDRISGYKVPRHLAIVETIPKTLYGKVDRNKLREQASRA